MSDFFEMMKIMQPRTVCFLKKVFSAMKEGSYNVLFFPLVILKSLTHRLHRSKNVTQKAEFL